MLQAITGARVFDGETFHQYHALLHVGPEVVGLVPWEQIPKDAARVSLTGGVLAPGFIDVQVNGGGGELFSNSLQAQSLATIALAHRQLGTTQILPTLISSSNASRKQALFAVQEALDDKVPGILGLHLEGPNFNPARRGVHKEGYLQALGQAELELLSAYAKRLAPAPLVITLAPEQCEAGQIGQLAAAGIIVCAGHTDASHQQIAAAIDEGLRGFTHLFNAMRPMQARDPGVVGAALANDDTWCGLIADGHHVHPVSLQVAIKAKAQGKIFFVSDAMATVGSASKTFSLYGEEIREVDGKLLNAEQRLAGSAIAQIDAVKLGVEKLHLPLQEALRMASLYPAQFLRLDKRYGRLIKKYCADIVHFDENFRVLNTWLAGERQIHTLETSA